MGGWHNDNDPKFFLILAILCVGFLGYSLFIEKEDKDDEGAGLS